MHLFDLEARNNADFVFIRNVQTWAQLYDLTTAVLRMQLRRPGASQQAAFEFSTLNNRISFDVQSKQVSISARAADLSHLTGTYNYDLRVEIGEAIRHPIFGGTVTFIEGATR